MIEVVLDCLFEIVCSLEDSVSTLFFFFVLKQEKVIAFEGRTKKRESGSFRRPSDSAGTRLGKECFLPIKKYYNRGDLLHLHYVASSIA